MILDPGTEMALAVVSGLDLETGVTAVPELSPDLRMMMAIQLPMMQTIALQWQTQHSLMLMLTASVMPATRSTIEI